MRQFLLLFKSLTNLFLRWWGGWGGVWPMLLVLYDYSHAVGYCIMLEINGDKGIIFIT